MSLPSPTPTLPCSYPLTWQGDPLGEEVQPQRLLVCLPELVLSQPCGYRRFAGRSIAQEDNFQLPALRVRILILRIRHRALMERSFTDCSHVLGCRRCCHAPSAAFSFSDGYRLVPRFLRAPHARTCMGRRAQKGEPAREQRSNNSACRTTCWLKWHQLRPSSSSLSPSFLRWLQPRRLFTSKLRRKFPVLTRSVLLSPSMPVIPASILTPEQRYCSFLVYTI